MTAYRLIVDLRRAGAMLSAANGHRLAFDAPPGVMTAEVRAALVKCKTEVLAVLNTNYFDAALELAFSAPRERWEELGRFFDDRADFHERSMDPHSAQRRAYIDLARAVERERCDLTPLSNENMLAIEQV